MTSFDISSQQRIKNWNQNLDRKVTITLKTTAHTEDNLFINIAGEFEKSASQVHIQKSEESSGLPGFTISDNFMFCALPMQKELSPFLDAVTQFHIKKPHLPEAQTGLLEKVTVPVSLKLYIALQCPHCPVMVGTLSSLCARNPKLMLTIIDGSLFLDVAQKDKVMAAPCLILDDDFRWTGNVSAEEILEMIIKRDPAALGVESLKNILEQGDASWITGQMMEHGKIFDNFIALLLHETWSVRLGAMVIVEELAAEAPELAKEMCSPLTAVFSDKDTTVQGDILYAFGEAGGLDIAAWIEEQMPTFSHPDLKDAAIDAIESIKERHE